MDELSYCNACNALILFIRTPKGRLMPCDSARVEYVPDKSARQFIVNSRGELVRGWIVGSRGPKSLQGYVPHWGTCSLLQGVPRGRAASAGVVAAPVGSGAGEQQEPGAADVREAVGSGAGEQQEPGAADVCVAGAACGRIPAAGGEPVSIADGSIPAGDGREPGPGGAAPSDRCEQLSLFPDRVRFKELGA